MVGNKLTQMVNPRVKTNLIHDGNASILALLVQLHHGRRDVAGRDDILLVADTRLDNEVVEDVRDQADDQIMLGHLGVEGLLVTNVDGNGAGVLDALDELLGGLEGSASCGSP